jgi:hypothetical protein
LYSVIAGIIGTIFLLVAGVLHLLWVGKSLKDATAWRQKLEEAMKSGTHAVVGEWESHGLAFPVSPEGIEAELARARKCENNLQRLRKTVIVAFYVGGTLLAILAILLAVST